MSIGKKGRIPTDFFLKKQNFFCRKSEKCEKRREIPIRIVHYTPNDRRVNRGGKGDKKGRVDERKWERREERCGFQKKCKKVLTPKGRFGIINERSRERRTLTSK